MEIGATLRETRIRAGISVEEIEQRTKIRAKYLRALENEEWGLLPSPAYVRSFLRSYAEALGLDARLLIDDYRRRFEAVPEAEMHAYGEPILTGRVGAPRGPRFSVPPWVWGAVVVALLIVALGILGSLGGSDKHSDRAETVPTTTTRTSTTPASKPKPKPKPRKVRVTIAATGAVWVCMLDAAGTRRIDARVLQAGQKAGPFRSRRFRITFGNGNAKLVVGGKPFQLRPVSKPIGFEVTPKGRRTLPDSKRPTCA